ncbi:hypothetical protein P2H44_20045 [Albimonas sp. CAU 1670]|uniref:hypothetical protein n=1 Tax=Albimonas sp. CAU 1670 TaxID=3032599 RepID=UPI0023DB0699|nr:hypothetical protein [Albimonas sp. CAU 1670]MDF2234859.1 hypothetical protein [Albimonas sp. CAU 1670]
MTGLPRYLRERRTKSGVAYYWIPRSADVASGWMISSVPLGRDLAAAIVRAEALNGDLDAWRAGLDTSTTAAARPGSLDWMLTTYQASPRFRQLAVRSRDEYRRHMAHVSDRKTKRGRRVGDLAVADFDGAAADTLYLRLQTVEEEDGTIRHRIRQADFEIVILKAAWDVVQRLHPEAFPKGNPFRGVTPVKRRKATKTPATRAQAYALAEALRGLGHPGLGAAALICFEWLQRPENVLDGALAWTDYRPGASVRIDHWKTGETIDLALASGGVALFPEIEAYLATVPKLGAPVVCWTGDHARRPGRRAEAPVARPYTHRHAHSVVARARKAAGLPDHVTLAACRHGGFTELGEAELTDGQIRALGGHRSPTMPAVYAKRTDKVREGAARRRFEMRQAEAGAGSDGTGSGTRVETSLRNRVETGGSKQG